MSSLRLRKFKEFAQFLMVIHWLWSQPLFVFVWMLQHSLCPERIINSGRQRESKDPALLQAVRLMEMPEPCGLGWLVLRGGVKEEQVVFQVQLGFPSAWRQACARLRCGGEMCQLCLKNQTDSSWEFMLGCLGSSSGEGRFEVKVLDFAFRQEWASEGF